LTGEADQVIEVESGGPLAPARGFLPRPLIFMELPLVHAPRLTYAIVSRYGASARFGFTGDERQYAAFRAMPVEERGRFDLLHGHVHYGVHRWLPVPATCITLLRDPVDRIISYYCFVRRTPGHQMHQELRAAGWSLPQFAGEPPNWETDNDQVRWLAEIEHGRVPPGEVSRGMLEEAKWNLQNGIAVLGLLERLEESISCMRAALCWHDLCRDDERKARAERPEISLPRRSLQSLRHANRFDLELYEFARERFERQMLRLGVPVAPQMAEGAAPPVRGSGDETAELVETSGVSHD
jgi:hypothetical protein